MLLWKVRLRWEGRKMSGEELNYSGIAWPSAKVISADPLEYKRTGPGLLVEPPPLVFEIAAAGPERPWQANRPQAFWRTLSEFVPSADPSLGERYAAFVRRFGPVREPSSDAPLVTLNWDGVQGHLHHVAQAWEEAGADGLSRVTVDRKRRDVARRWLSHFVLSTVMDDVGVVFDSELRPILQPRTLYAFMALSAASMLRRQALMRRCGHCGIWFEPPRSDALYCSNACRGAHHIARTRPESKRPRVSRREQMVVQIIASEPVPYSSDNGLTQDKYEPGQIYSVLDFVGRGMIRRGWAKQITAADLKTENAADTTNHAAPRPRTRTQKKARARG
jgi:hypothetical protein